MADEPKPIVLIVDDSPVNLRLLEHILEPLKVSVLKAKSGFEAIEKARNVGLAAIVCDVEMPEMDGYATVEHILDERGDDIVPVIFVTALEETHKHTFRGYEAGGVDYLYKPFDPIVMRSKLRVFIDLYEMRCVLQGEIAERRRAEQERAESEARYRILVELSPEAVLVVNDGCIEYINPAGVELFGEETGEVLLDNMLGQFVAEEDQKPVKNVLSNIVASETDDETFEFRIAHRGLDVVVEAHGATFRQGGHSAIILTLHDVSARKAVENELRRLSTQDGLTGIANRRVFNEILEQEWKRAKRHGIEMSLIMADIDYFKQYNDNYGHHEGDTCLRKVARALSEMAAHRSGDLLARYGGEEFAVILPHTPERNAGIVAKTMCEAIHELALEHAFSSVSNIVTLSIGVASMVPEASKPPEYLIRCADAALYAAKRAGRDRITAFSDIEAAGT